MVVGGFTSEKTFRQPEHSSGTLLIFYLFEDLAQLKYDKSRRALKVYKYIFLVLRDSILT